MWKQIRALILSCFQVKDMVYTLHDGGSKFMDRVDVEAWGWGVMWSPGALGKT